MEWEVLVLLLVLGLVLGLILILGLILVLNAGQGIGIQHPSQLLFLLP